MFALCHISLSADSRVEKFLLLLEQSLMKKYPPPKPKKSMSAIKPRRSLRSRLLEDKLSTSEEKVFCPYCMGMMPGKTEGYRMWCLACEHRVD